MLLLNVLLFIVTFEQSKGKMSNGCKVDVEFVNDEDPTRIICHRTCDENVSETPKGESGPKKFYYRNDEIDKVLNKVVEIIINEDGSIQCRLVNPAENLDMIDSLEQPVNMFRQPSILLEDKATASERSRMDTNNECGDKSYEYVEDIDWCVKVSFKRQSWNKAQLACVSEGGTFAVIDTLEKDKAIRELLHRMNVMDAWIGLSDTNVEGTFEWRDGTPLLHTSWYEGQPDEAMDEEDCVHYFKPYGYSWKVHYCNTFFQYICEKKKTYPVTTTSPALNVGVPACPNGWLKSAISNVCYHVGSKTHNYIHSVTYCQERGGSLATIHNREEMQFIEDMLLQNDFEKIWIGLSDEAVEDNFQWIDGSSLNFVSWNSDQPDNEGGNEDCVSVDRLHNFQWNDVSCEDFLRPLCMKKSETLPIFIKGCSSGCVIVQTIKDFGEWELNCPKQSTGSLVCVPKPIKAGYTNYKPLFVICLVCCIVTVLFVFYVFRSFMEFKKEQNMIKEYVCTT